MEPLQHLLDLGSVGKPKPVEAPISVLVVEAEAGAQGELREALEAEGLRVQILPNGTQLLQAARSGNHDAIVLSFDLPGEDGMELVKRVRRGGIWIPVIFTSEEDSEEVALKAYESGAWDHAVKGQGFAPGVATKVRQWVVRYRTTAGVQAQFQRIESAGSGGATRELAGTLAEGIGQPLKRILEATEELLRRVKDPTALQLLRDVQGWARTAQSELQDIRATEPARRPARRA